jgi:hypothetical protein
VKKREGERDRFRKQANFPDWNSSLWPAANEASLPRVWVNM